MLNDFLSSEEARERIKQSIHEAEANSLLKRLGYQSDATARWVILLILIAVVAIGLIL